jgi:hypothetical protein
MSYEYMVIPAPTRGIKNKDARTAEERFAIAIETKLNKMSNDGWDYMRTDTLPAEQREGLMGKTTVYQNMLVFRRTKAAQRPVAPVPTPVVTAPPPPKVEPVKEVAPVKPVSDDEGDADA